MLAPKTVAEAMTAPTTLADAFDNDFSAAVCRRIVIDHMYHGGIAAHKINDEQWCELYLLADGFGEVTEQWAVAQDYDWSHVRDSSPAAFTRMFKHLKEMLS